MADFDLRLLPAFVTLADELHFGRAAHRLHIGQPALSQQLARLERQLGVQLVERDTRRVLLTPAGHAFLAGSRSALVLAHGAAAAARDTLTGKLAFRLGIDIDVPTWLVRRVRRFGTNRSELDLRLTIAQQDDLLAALDRAELDAVAVWGGAPAGNEGIVLAVVPIHGVIRVDDVLAQHETLAATRLVDEKLAIYLPNDETRPFYEHVLATLAVDGRVPQTTHVRPIDDAQEAMLDRVENQGGFTFCIARHLDEVDRPALVERPFVPPLHAEIVARWHGTQPPPALDALRSWLE